MRIISLVENTTNKDLQTEHGLSLYIEAAGQKILFDTGQSDLFARNAEKMSVDLKTVDICILSHGHYDHGGGLKTFATINDTAPIYMNKNAFGLHYHGDERYIGLNRDWLHDEELQHRINYLDGGMEIDKDISIVAPGNNRKVDMGSAGLCVKENDEYRAEDFRHEHYLLIKENGKRILISGCSHQGIINIMDWYKPDVLIGGFHFMNQDHGETLQKYGEMLDKYDTEYYTCHCTGVEQYEFLRHYIKHLQYLSEGEEMRI